MTGARQPQSSSNFQAIFFNILNKKHYWEKGNNGSVFSPSPQLSYAQATVRVVQKEHIQVLAATREG